VVFSSPELVEGETYTVTVGEQTKDVTIGEETSSENNNNWI
jgi:hypothetical protein